MGTSRGNRAGRGIRAGLAAAGVVAALVAVPTAASASIGTGVGAADIVAAAAVPAGHSARLTPLYIVNTGSDPADYQIRVQPVGPQAGRPLPAAWLHLDSSAVSLRPGAHASVPVSATVPGSVSAGDYSTSLLVTAVAPARQGGGVAVGAAAAARVRLTVAAPTAAGPWIPSAVWYLLALLLVVTVLVAVVRRSGLRLHVEREPRTRLERRTGPGRPGQGRSGADRPDREPADREPASREPADREPAEHERTLR